MLVGAPVLRRLLRRLIGWEDPNPLAQAIRDTRPDPSEAECERYRDYHRSNQWGR